MRLCTLASVISSRSSSHGAGGEEHAPEVAGAQQHQPLFRVRDVVDEGQALDLVGEVERRGEHEEELGEGEPLELDALRDAHERGGAVRADQVASALGALLHALEAHERGDTALVLVRADYGLAEVDLEAVFLLQALVEDARELPLLGLHAVGVRGAARELREVEGGDRAGVAVAVLPGRGDHPLLDHLLGDAAELVEHVEGRRVEGRGARVDGEAGLGLEDRDGDAPPRRGTRRRRARRARRPRSARDPRPPCAAPLAALTSSGLCIQSAGDFCPPRRRPAGGPRADAL